MGTFWAIVVVLGAGALIALNIWLHDPDAARVARQKRAEATARIVCKFCQTAGRVSVRPTWRKKGVSGGKATGALLTGGASMLLTGLSRKEPTRELSCGNCGMTWDEV